MSYWEFWLAILALVSVWWLSNRGLVRSIRARDAYGKAISELNLWLESHPHVCPCQYEQGRQLQQAVVSTFIAVLRVPQNTANPDYLNYLKKFHSTGCLGITV